jgi:hypothetical protein
MIHKPNPQKKPSFIVELKGGPYDGNRYHDFNNADVIEIKLKLTGKQKRQRNTYYYRTSLDRFTHESICELWQRKTAAEVLRGIGGIKP